MAASRWRPRIVASVDRNSLGAEIWVTLVIASLLCSWYRVVLVHSPMARAKEIVEVERVQTGVRLEKRLLKMLKAVAELKDMSLGDLLDP